MKKSNKQRQSPLSASQLREHWIDLAAFLAIAFVNLLVFHHTFDLYFFSDDFCHVWFVHDLIHNSPQYFFQRLHFAWIDESIQLVFRPMVELTLAVNYLCGGADARVYHLTNLLLHTCTAYGVFGV